MSMSGRRVTIRPMRPEDVDVMTRWRPIADPLYQPFDFPHDSSEGNRRWFDERRGDPTRRLYTVEDEHGRVIGSLTLREIDGLRSARLGITLGADFLSQGYGTEALAVFLDYYFEVMGFAQMVLDVAATNQRAVRSYRSVGFRVVAQHWQPAAHPSYRTLLREPRYRHLRAYLRQQGNQQQVLFYDMTLSRSDWAQGRSEVQHPQAFGEVHGRSSQKS